MDSRKILPKHQKLCADNKVEIKKDEKDILLDKLNENVNILLYSNSINPIINYDSEGRKEIINSLDEQEDYHHVIGTILRLYDWKELIGKDIQILDPSIVPNELYVLENNLSFHREYLSKEQSQVFVKDAIKNELKFMELYNAEDISKDYETFIPELHQKVDDQLIR